MRATTRDGRTLEEIPAKAVTGDQETAVRRLVASHAEDSDEEHALLQMLGIPSTPSSVGVPDPRPAKSSGTPKRRRQKTQ
ncbi:hypothetical protein [Nocardia sp. NPDC005745]|uniref:hypothetical protein n=1 Tax=Nocardia sp. NPDC005745 TaxID=3157061 RepID=UPI0033F0E42B